jgi:5-methylcytosine-specific restriction endonuclease McrA
VDHIVRRSDGGSDEWSNLQPLCHSCHSMKTSREGPRGKGGEISEGLLKRPRRSALKTHPRN